MQILGKKDFPSLNETISIIRAEEGRRTVMLETRIGDGSALVTKIADSRNQGLHSLLKVLANKQIRPSPSIGTILFHILQKALPHGAGNSMASPR